MIKLTDHGAAVRDDLSRRYGVSPDAVSSLMDAVVRGGGTQAQFSHPEIGGMGQWSSGGMTMVGDMFNTGLQNLVANLCGEISNAYFQGPFFPPPPKPVAGWQGQAQSQGGGPSMQISGGSFGSWWPAELGHPSSTGSQNNLSYAIFPGTRRLAVNLNGRVTVYDTGDHMIGGVGQQQSGDASWTFTSQYGTVYLNQLPVVAGEGAEPRPQAAHAPEPAPSARVTPTPAAEAPAEAHDEPAQVEAAPEPAAKPEPKPAAKGASSDEIFAALEKLGSLRDMGVLSEDEFAAKKAELLARI